MNPPPREPPAQLELDLRAAQDELVFDKARLDAADARLDAAQGDLRAAQSDLRAAQSDLRAANARLDAANARLDAAQGDLRAANARLDAALAAQTEAHENLRKVGKSTSAQEKQRLQDVAKAADQQVVAQNASIAAQIASIAALNASIAALNASVAAQNASIAALNASVAEKDATIAAINATIAGVVASIKNLESDIAVAQNKLVNVVAYLSRPLAEPTLSDNPPAGNTTTSLVRKVIVHKVPKRVALWEDFEAGLGLFREQYKDTLVANPNQEDDLGLDFNDERMFAGYFGQPRRGIKLLLDALYPHTGYSDIAFTSSDYSSRTSGSVDETCNLHGQAMYVGEHKFWKVVFETDKTAAELYGSTNDGVRPPHGSVTCARNLLNTIIQTYTYMIAKTPEDNVGLQYAYASNWESWFFFKRTVVGNDEVLLVSRVHRRDADARLAYAFFLRLTVEAGGATVRYGDFGEIPKMYTELQKEHEEEKKSQEPSNHLRHNDKAGKWDREASAGAREEQETVTTAEAFGLNGGLFTLPSVPLSRSMKSATRRGMVNGRDLVWKTVDFLGTPKHTEWSYKDLDEAMENEVMAYDALKELQGKVIPEFVFRGSDLNFIWAVVTTYEGQSLATLGALSEAVKDKARDALRTLHEWGVLHGDVALRNAVRRERDGAVLWVDLEMTKFKGYNVPVEEFVQQAWQEMRLLEECLEEAEQQQLAVVAAQPKQQEILAVPHAAPAAAAVDSPPATTASPAANKISPAEEKQKRKPRSRKQLKVAPGAQLWCPP
jgi:uncharacterized coiled-coil protein SlyX